MTPDKPTKAVISVIEMAEMVALSKSRFYSLIEAGIFPVPLRNESCKRPVYDLELQQKCLDIRRTGIGANGHPVVFNRKRLAAKQRPSKPKSSASHAELLDALKSLGLQTNAEAIESALHELYPSGRAHIDEGQKVRQVFLHLQRRRS